MGLSNPFWHFGPVGWVVLSNLTTLDCIVESVLQEKKAYSYNVFLGKCHLRWFRKRFIMQINVIKIMYFFRKCVLGHTIFIMFNILNNAILGLFLNKKIEEKCWFPMDFSVGYRPNFLSLNLSLPIENPSVNTYVLSVCNTINSC